MEATDRYLTRYMDRCMDKRHGSKRNITSALHVAIYSSLSCLPLTIEQSRVHKATSDSKMETEPVKNAYHTWYIGLMCAPCYTNQQCVHSSAQYSNHEIAAKRSRQSVPHPELSEHSHYVGPTVLRERSRDDLQRRGRGLECPLLHAFHFLP